MFCEFPPLSPIPASRHFLTSPPRSRQRFCIRFDWVSKRQSSEVSAHKASSSEPGSRATIRGVDHAVFFLSKVMAATRENSGDNALQGSLKRPQREGLSSSKIGILMKNKIKTTVVARTDERFVFAKNKGIERASIFPASNANGYAVLAVLRLDSNNFGRNGFHWCFLV